MELSPEGKIYYVTSKEGQCQIRMIDPISQMESKVVIEIKSNTCFGFKICANKFYFIKDDRVIDSYESNMNNMLLKTNQYYMKVKERYKFNQEPYQEMIINEKCIMIDSRIFYI